MIKEKTKYDPKNWMQDEAKFLTQTVVTSIELNKPLYAVYFDEFRILGFFKKNPFIPSNKTLIPEFIIKLKDILMLNFRVPERINGETDETCSSASATAQANCTRSGSFPM